MNNEEFAGESRLEYTYRVLVHPKGRMWAVGTTTTKLVTISGETKEFGWFGDLLENGNIARYYAYRFTFRTKPQPLNNSNIDVKVELEKRLKKGYIERRGLFYEYDDGLLLPQRTMVNRYGQMLFTGVTPPEPQDPPFSRQFDEDEYYGPEGYVDDFLCKPVMAC